MIKGKKYMVAGMLACLLSGSAMLPGNASAQDRSVVAQPSLDTVKTSGQPPMATDMAAPATVAVTQKAAAPSTVQAEKKSRKDRRKKSVQPVPKTGEETALNIQQRVAAILRKRMAEEDKWRARSHMMRMWPVESEDTGGTLIFSDSPESVTEDGILYQDSVTGDARVLYYHLNSSDAPKKVAVVLENDGEGSAIVRVTRGGTSMPSGDYLDVGKNTQEAYFNSSLHELIYLRPDNKKLLQSQMDEIVLQPGQLVYGVYDFTASRKVKVSVIMYPADKDPFDFLKTARVLPKDEQRLRGTFHGMDRIVTSRTAYDPAQDGVVYFPLADDIHDRYRVGIDATDGSQVVNYGNYGVLYRLEIPTRGNGSTQYFLSPLGGVYAGAMTVQHGMSPARMLSTPYGRTFFGDSTPPEAPNTEQARNEGLAILTKYTELADLGTYANNRETVFEFSPPGASNLPVNIIMMPSDN